MKKKSFRTRMPFDQGLSPTTEKSTWSIGNDPSIQSIINGDKNTNDLHGRGSWGDGEDHTPSYKEKGDDYRNDLKLLNVINELRNHPQKQDKWTIEDQNGNKKTFDSLEELQCFRRRMKLNYKNMSCKTAQSDVENIRNGINSTVLIKTTSIETKAIELGAGFHIGNGIYITCAHVIQRYDKNQRNSGGITNFRSVITLERDGQFGEGSLLASDLGLDIAIIKSNFYSEALPLDVRLPSIGEEVFAIGSPRGFENNVSSGIVSGINREIFNYPNPPKFIFTDANVLPGNSGGPLISYETNSVIGMLSLIVGAESLYGLNAALQIDFIRSFLEKNQIKT